MNTKTIIGLAAASLVAIAAPASASTIGHFAPAGAAGGNLNAYIGSGISNDNMVLDSAGGISLGLKSHNRFSGDWGAATLDGDRGVYSVDPGAGPGGAGLTKWSYLYVVDFGSETATEYGIRVKLDFDGADGDVADGDWYVIDFPMDALFGNSFAQSETMGFDYYGSLLEGTNTVDLGGGNMYDYMVSGSDNYIDIDPNTAGRYDVEVEIYALDSNGAFTGDAVVASAMSVVVVPLPPAAWAGLAGLAGAAAMRRRFTK